MNIENNQYLFYICIGLTASGSDGYDHNDIDVSALVNQVRAALFPNDIKTWFSRARTGQIAVNPYWPRGSCLAAACFFVDDQYQMDMDSFLAFLKSTGGICDPVSADDFQNWIAELPRILRILDAHPAIPALWKEYCRIVDMRLPEWDMMVNKAIHAAKEFFNDLSPKISFNPNLFTHYSTDFVRIGDKIITIACMPDAESMLHETLHTAVAVYRTEILDFARLYGLGRFADRDKMMEFGYMEDDSPASAAHVIEECFVRALAVVLSKGSDERLRFHAEYGCNAAPFIGACVRDIKPTAATLGMFISTVLGKI